MSVGFRELAFEFTCVDRPSIGIVSLPEDTPPRTGVLIIVGGPQYRVGAHRQFVSLARQLARQGMAVMRFDVRGMGDCVGPHPGFDHLNGDVRSAIDAFAQQVPGLQRVVLWGLCDGASAACLYAPHDHRVAGLVLLNPWAETAAGSVATRLRHYYVRRLMSGEFWRKLLDGRVDWRHSARALVGTLGRLANRRTKGASAPAAPSTTAPALPAVARASAPASSSTGASANLPVEMARCVLRSHVPLYIALSEDDLVARQFEDQALPLPEWDAVQRLQTLETVHLAGADHTLSTPGAKPAIEALTARWVQAIASGRHKKTLILHIPRMKSNRLYAKVVFGVVVGLTALDL